MSNRLRLLINCDDLGYHPTFNEAIIEILARRVIRSASLMPAAPHFDDAVRRLAAAGIERVGVHLTLGSEYKRLPIKPLSEPSQVPSLIDADGRFFRDISAHRDDIVPEQAQTEFRNQIERARHAGLRLTHLDGHMFCYEAELGGPRLLEVANNVARDYGLPLRCRSTNPHSLPATHMLWAEADSVEERLAYYKAFLESYREPLAELIIHPGKDLAAMQEFSLTGHRRRADYLFFSGAAFEELARARSIEIITWDDTDACDGPAP